MPPLVPAVSPVPPCATVTAALLVSTVAEALGNVNVLSVDDGPVTAKNPLPDPPFAPGRMPETSAVNETAVQDSAAPEASTPFGYWPAEQFAPLAANAVEVLALPVSAPVNPVEVTEVSPVMVAGKDSVTAPVDALAVIWFAVPAMVVGSAVQLSAAPKASTPRGNCPALQLAPFAASAVAVAALPVVLPEEPVTLPVTLPVRAPVKLVEVTEVRPVIVAGSDNVIAPVEADAVI